MIGNGLVQCQAAMATCIVWIEALLTDVEVATLTIIMGK